MPHRRFRIFSLRSISPNSRRGFARSPLCTFYGASLRFASNSYPLTSYYWKLLSAVQTGRTLRMLILIDVGAVALWLVLSCGAVPCSERSTSDELTPEDLPRQSGDLERARPAAAPIGAVSKPVGESRLCPSRMCRRPGDNRAGDRWILRGCSSGGGLAAPVGWLRCGSPSPGRPTSRHTRPP
jgi:hypothetical protein